jgi:hypothetical protein
MGNLFNALNSLKSNIFGSGAAGTTTPILRKSAIELADTSPLSRMSDDPFQFASISYPRDVTNDMQSGHYMLFYVNVQNDTKYKYEGGIGGVTVEEKTVTTAGVPQLGIADSTKIVEVKSQANAADVAYHKGLVKGGTPGSVVQEDGVDLSKGNRQVGKMSEGSMSTYINTTSRITDSVALYLPPNVTDTTAAAYNGFAMGMIGFAAAGGGEFTRAMKSNDFSRAAKALVGQVKGFTDFAAKEAGMALAEAVGGAEGGGTELINKAFGRADNPYMEVLFDKMALRTFTYNFTFAPRNTDERDDVQKIIQLFRFHMAPELRGDFNRFLTLPSTFDIHYMYQTEDGKASENDFYNRIATCVLENCTVDYTPGGVRSFADGSPTQITMALTFKETELLTKERINAGF